MILVRSNVETVDAVKMLRGIVRHLISLVLVEKVVQLLQRLLIGQFDDWIVDLKEIWMCLFVNLHNLALDRRILAIAIVRIVIVGR